MDTERFDDLVRSLTAFPSRHPFMSRRALFWRCSAAFVFATSTNFPMLARAGRKKHKKHKKRKKHKKHPCPESRRCAGNVCCLPGHICAGAACLIGQGACATGSDSCAAGIPILCAENCLCTTSTEGGTRCTQGGIDTGCGSCTSSAECVTKYGAASFCSVAGPGCGCQAGEGVCGFACFG